ncbi:MAG: hypothetical protein QM581_16230 [Pseudomonas sp.]
MSDALTPARSVERKVAKWLFIAALAVYPLAGVFYQGWRNSSGLADSYAMGLVYALLMATMAAVPLMVLALVFWLAGRDRQ